MSLKKKIQEDIKIAMKEKKAEELSVLRMLMANILNKEKEKRTKLSKDINESEKLEEQSNLTEEEALESVSSEIKKRKDSIEQYKKGDRNDLAEKEKREMDILMKYMPEQMSEDEIRDIVKNKIIQLKASTPQDTGKVMGAAMSELKGKADGNIVNKIVQEELKNN